jgi:hypothetical protein
MALVELADPHETSYGGCVTGMNAVDPKRRS